MTRQVSSQKKCVNKLFKALAKLAGAKEKVKYLLDTIEQANGVPSTIIQWNTLFNKDKYRIPNTSVLKKELMDPLQWGSIAQLSNEMTENVLSTGKVLENAIGTRNSQDNVFQTAYRIVRDNIGDDFIYVQNRTGMAAVNRSGGYTITKNVWQPEADLLFRGEGGDMYDFVDIEQSKIIKQPPVKVKYDFQHKHQRTMHNLTRLWNTLFNQTTAGPHSMEEGTSDSWNFLCRGILNPSGRMHGGRIPLRDYASDIKELAAVYEKYFVELIPYLPADMYRDAPDDGPDYTTQPDSESEGDDSDVDDEGITDGDDSDVDDEGITDGDEAVTDDEQDIHAERRPGADIARAINFNSNDGL